MLVSAKTSISRSMSHICCCMVSRAQACQLTEMDWLKPEAGGSISSRASSKLASETWLRPRPGRPKAHPKAPFHQPFWCQPSASGSSSAKHQKKGDSSGLQSSWLQPSASGNRGCKRKAEDGSQTPFQHRRKVPPQPLLQPLAAAFPHPAAVSLGPNIANLNVRGAAPRLGNEAFLLVHSLSAWCPVQLTLSGWGQAPCQKLN